MPASAPTSDARRPPLRINLATQREGRSGIECPGCTECFFCGAALSSRHEHDHFPLPFEDGGKRTVPACVNCHDLKDRIPLDCWPEGLARRALTEWLRWCPPPGLARLYHAKLLAIWGRDVMKLRDDALQERPR
jgi:hypothetical protein